MKIQRLKYSPRKGEITIETARPALIRSRASQNSFWSFTHADDGGRESGVYLPVAGQAMPCPERGRFYQEGTADACPSCGTRLRAWSQGETHLSVHPDRGFVPPGSNFILRQTRSGQHELLERDGVQTESVLILMRPNGLTVKPSVGVRQIACGLTAQGHEAPVFLAPRTAGFVFADPETGHPVAGAARTDGQWRVMPYPGVVLTVKAA